MSGDTINMSGNFQGAIVNVKSTLTNVTQTIGAMPNVDQASKDDLKALIEQLSETLQQAPADHKDDAEAVAESAKVLVDTAAKETPNKTMVKITAEGLKQAAKNIAGVMPTVLTIATQIVQTVLKFTGAAPIV